jgi:hypothetical protein
MNSGIAEPKPLTSPDPQSTLGKDPSSQVQALLSALQPACRMERRTEQRFPFPYLIRLTPVGVDNALLDEQVVVVGKHLSHHGLGFYHQHPIAHRRMIATIELPTGRQIGFLLDLTWCRFTKQGWYESGGRLLQSIAVEDRDLPDASWAFDDPFLDH